MTVGVVNTVGSDDGDEVVVAAAVVNVPCTSCPLADESEVADACASAPDASTG